MSRRFNPKSEPTEQDWLNRLRDIRDRLAAAEQPSERECAQ